MNLTPPLEQLPRFLIALGVTAMLGLTVWSSVAHRRDVADPLPTLATVPDFSLTERSGKPFKRRDLDGLIWIVDFIFTSCAGTCPVMSGNMQRLHDQFSRYSDVKFLSFTVDPQNDTPAVLRGYAKGFGAREGRWFFVTGPKNQLHTLAQQGFKLSVFEEGSADGDFTHSQKFALLDRDANIRGYFDGTDTKELKRLKQEVERLLQE